MDHAPCQRLPSRMRAAVLPRSAVLTRMPSQPQDHRTNGVARVLGGAFSHGSLGAMLPAPRRQGIAGVCRWATRNRGRCWRGAHPWRRSRLVGCAPLVRLRDWDSCGEGWCVAMHALCAQWARGLTACPQAQGSEGGSSTLLLTEWAHVRSPLLLEGGIVHAAARGIIASLRGRLLHAAAQRRYGLCPETQHPVDDVWVRLDGGAPTRAGARGSACGELVLVRGSSGTLQRLHTRRGRDHSYLADACVGSCHRGRPRRARASMASADETRRPSGSLLAWMLVRGCLDERSAVDLCWPRGGRSERVCCCSRRSAAHRVGPSWCPQRAWCGGDLLGRRREMVGFRPGGENGDGGGFRAQALRAWWEASSVPGGLSPGGRRSLSLVAMSARPCVHRPCMPPRGTQRS